jgi:hypothetical protein
MDRPSLGRRCIRGAGWAIPSVGLVLMPKCPACVAAYIAAGTGVGISMPVAGVLRMSLIVACSASLVYLAVRRVRRMIAKRLITSR